MCGIFAYFDPAGEPPPFDYRKVLESLRNRGPDGHGIMHDQGCSLLHTRLAILDPARGQQPMRHAATGLILSYNGEVYNAPELRASLARRGHAFRTQTDTEVVLAAFAEFGVAAVAMMEGMFAFAIWDPRHRQLHLVRDRMGQKPLFLVRGVGGRVFAASELKALRAADISLSPDARSLDAYLRWKHVPAKRTIYREVEVVPPAAVMTFGMRSVRTNRYWQLPQSESAPARADVLDELQAKLALSVETLLRSDRGTGVLLSSGIDSTLIAATAARATGERLTSYTASYHGVLDEAGRAADTASRLGLDHVRVPIEAPEPDGMAAICAYLDQPHADSANLAHALLSRRASCDVAVVLSGDGADELFGGYDWYCDLRSVRQRLERMTILSREERRALLLDGDWAPEFDGIADRNPFDAVNRLDLEEYLGGQLLPKADMLGMMHGLEIRAPFLDYRLIEFARRLPVTLKTGVPSKPLLRRLLARLDPDASNDDRKQGFGAPLIEWLAQPGFRTFARDTLGRGARIRNLVDPAVLDRQLTAAWARPDRAAAYRIWLFLCLELWAVSLEPVGVTDAATHATCEAGLS